MYSYLIILDERICFNHSLDIHIWINGPVKSPKNEFFEKVIVIFRECVALPFVMLNLVKVTFGEVKKKTQIVVQLLKIVTQ